MVDFHLMGGRISILGLAELALHVAKYTLGENLDIGNLNSFEPDAPALSNRSNRLHDEVSDMLAFFDNLHDLGIGNVVSDDSSDGGVDQIVSGGWNILYKIITEVLVSLHGAITFTVNLPDNHSGNFNTLHFLGDLLATKVNFVDL